MTAPLEGVRVMRDAVLHETRPDVGVSGAWGGAAAGFGLGWADGTAGLGWADGTAGLGGWTACRSRTALASACCWVAVWVAKPVAHAASLSDCGVSGSTACFGAASASVCRAAAAVQMWCVLKGGWSRAARG